MSTNNYKVDPTFQNSPSWLFYSLLAAGAYNILWGAYVILFPAFSFEILGAEAPKYLEIWQCVGMIVGVYGLGYIIAAADPIKHWPIIFVGLLGKVLGPLGFIKALIDETFPLSFGINIVFNDLIWWFPFSYALLLAYRRNFPAHSDHFSEKSLLDFIKDNRSEVLSADRDVILVALRHHGCTFTKQALDDLAKLVSTHNKMAVYLVHMDNSGEFHAVAKSFLKDSNWREISDPEQRWYRALGLSRAQLHQAFGWQEWKKGFLGFIKGYYIGPLRGDGFQLAGAAYFTSGKLVDIIRTTRASDRIPFEKLIKPK